MKKYNTLDIFSCLCEFYFLREININDLFSNFKELKENEKYNSILSKYNFYDKFSPELFLDMANLVSKKRVILCNKNNSLLFINQKEKDIILNSIDCDTRSLFSSFMTDYRNMNIEKEKQKTFKI